MLCVDEKSQIQALDRTQPLLPLQPGQVERGTHDYKRHGTTSLSAALELKTNQVIGQMHRRHRSVEFRKFLDVIESQVPELVGCPSHRRQLRDSQNGDDPEVVRQAPTLPRSLHAHLRFLDQLGGTLVRRTCQQTDTAWCVSQCEGTGNRHPRIDPDPQPRSHAIRLGQNRRPNPSQHCSPRTTHSQRTPRWTYRTNHWDRRLVHNFDEMQKFKHPRAFIGKTNRTNKNFAR